MAVEVRKGKVGMSYARDEDARWTHGEEEEEEKCWMCVKPSPVSSRTRTKFKHWVVVM